MTVALQKVQSEILKKWKRWKLGRNIEEEYRHTYSNTPNNTKTASLLNHVSRPPQLPDITKSSGPACSPEERRTLVAGCHGNGTAHVKGEFSSEQGTVSSCSLTEDAGLPEKMQRENVESQL